MSPRNTPQSRSTSRQPARKQPRFKIFVYCEGKNTERAYLESFKRQHGNGLVDIIIVAPAGVAYTVVEKAVERKKYQDNIARKDKDGFAKRFQVWAVFDIDEHPNIPEAIELANQYKVKTAISNPCIEIWPLWHFISHSAYIHRKDLQALLADYMPSYKAEGSKLIDYHQIKDNYLQAKARAIEQSKAQQATKTNQHYDENPSTTIYVLLDKIIANGKPANIN